MKKIITIGLAAVCAGSMSASAEVIAGFDSNWDTSDARIEEGLQANWANVSGTVFAPQFRDSSNDGTFGTVAGADTTIGLDSSGHKYGLRASNTGAATISFTLTETAGVARTLDSFNFDAITRNGSSIGTYVLSVAAGDLTLGDVAGGTGAVANGFDQNVLGNNDIDLTGLADNVLDANGMVTFNLAFTQTANKSLGLDNVGIVGTIPEPATLGLVAAFGGAVLFIRRRFMI